VLTRGRYAQFPTTTLRAMKVSLSKWPWRRVLRSQLYAIEEELLARELPSIADESGGFLVSAVEGVH
jgi:hypothetical protein